MKSGEFEAKSGHQNMKSGHQKPKSGEQCKRRYSSLPIIILFIFIHRHYLFYVAAFSATFKLLKTKFFILATHCTNKSKNTAIYLWLLNCDTKLGRIIQGGNLVHTEYTPNHRKYTP